MQNIKDAKYPLLTAPFFGNPITVKIQELTQAQIYACGGNEFSLIETLEDKRRGKVTIANQVEYSEKLHRIAKKALISPTYDEIIAQITDIDEYKRLQKELDEISIMLDNLPRGRKQRKLQEKFDKRRVFFDLLLPEDFLSFVVAYSLGIDKTDIKEVTKEFLINLAILAKRGHNNPSDHLDENNVFSAYNKDDINRRAWQLLDEYQKENK